MPKEEAKVLGVVLDSGLRYKSHIANTATRGLQAAMALKRLRLLSPSISRQLFGATVAPVIDYASPSGRPGGRPGTRSHGAISVDVNDYPPARSSPSRPRIRIPPTAPVVSPPSPSIGRGRPVAPAAGSPAGAGGGSPMHLDDGDGGFDVGGGFDSDSGSVGGGVGAPSSPARAPNPRVGAIIRNVRLPSEGREDRSVRVSDLSVGMERARISPVGGSFSRWQAVPAAGPSSPLAAAGPAPLPPRGAPIVVAPVRRGPLSPLAIRVPLALATASGPAAPSPSGSSPSSFQTAPAGDSPVVSPAAPSPSAGPLGLAAALVWPRLPLRREYVVALPSGQGIRVSSSCLAAYAGSDGSEEPPSQAWGVCWSWYLHRPFGRPPINWNGLFEWGDGVRDLQSVPERSTHQASFVSDYLWVGSNFDITSLRDHPDGAWVRHHY